MGQLMAIYHLEEGEVCVWHVVKVDLRVVPGMVVLDAGVMVRNVRRVELQTGRPVNAVVELAHKQLYPHDGEDEPKDKTDKQDVENGRNGLHEGVHHHLKG